jgi:hypothetical protein
MHCQASGHGRPCTGALRATACWTSPGDHPPRGACPRLALEALGSGGAPEGVATYNVQGFGGAGCPPECLSYHPVVSYDLLP